MTSTLHGKRTDHLSLCVCLSGGPGEEFDDVEDKATYRSMLIRDERRFKTADRDSDGIATREEFTAFLHPEEYDHMKAVVVQVLGQFVPFNSNLNDIVHKRAHGTVKTMSDSSSLL